MPLRDVNAATRLAKTSWRRDNISYKVYVGRTLPPPPPTPPYTFYKPTVVPKYVSNRPYITNLSRRQPLVNNKYFQWILVTSSVSWMCAGYQKKKKNQFLTSVYLGLKVCRHVTSMLRCDWLKLVGIMKVNHAFMLFWDSFYWTLCTYIIWGGFLCVWFLIELHVFVGCFEINVGTYIHIKKLQPNA